MVASPIGNALAQAGTEGRLTFDNLRKSPPASPAFQKYLGAVTARTGGIK